MQDKILHTASELFINFGVKSVTMDDIAQKLGISKKTIYDYYNNKEELVECTTNYLFDNITDYLKVFIADNHDKNPIEILFDSFKFIKQHFKKDHAPEYQLKKYFPIIYENISRKKFELITSVITHNLTLGVEQGYYRDNVNKDIIARFYYGSLTAIRDNEIFPSETFNNTEVMEIYTTYHIRAIATPKGIETLDKHLANNEL